MRLARAAFRRAVALTPMGQSVIGVAATCALVTSRARRGEHRVEVAAYTEHQVHVYSLVMEKGARDRYQEDHLSSRLLLQAIADACEVPIDTSLLAEELGAADVLTSRVQRHVDALDALLAGEERMVEFSSMGAIRGTTRAHIVLPGSFNPVHDGHRELLRAAQKLRPSRTAAYELSVTNADKGCLPKDQVVARIKQFLEPGSPAVICTDAPLYIAKARLMPNTSFVVGMDTARRLIMDKYYNDSHENMMAALAEIKTLGCEFLVGGRLDPGGSFEELQRLQVPQGLEGLFVQIHDFRIDVSSTELREQGLTLPIQED
mmetsp:Transcript_48009/g.89473  ORF Transcript_48009/g.89473 Transcript_48009/m.89473 type:complete len:318 (-) Transcript_48009:390-1343(-)